MPFPEEIAPVHHFSHQLLKRNAFPPALAALSNALQALQNPKRIAVGFQHGGPAAAHRGPLFLAAVAARRKRCQGFPHRHAHGQVMRGGERIVRISGGPDHFVLIRVNMQAHTAKGRTAPALIKSRALPLARRHRSIGGQTIFRGQGIFIFRVGNGHARSAFTQAAHHAPCRIKGSGGKNAQSGRRPARPFSKSPFFSCP